jgi:presequence protease
LNRQFEQFTPRTPSPFSTSSTRFTTPQSIETTGPIDPLADPKRQTITSIAFHTNELSDGIFEHFALDILFMLLTDGHSAPMHKALLDTGLGTGYSPITYHEMLGKTAFAAFGLEGVSADDEGRVEVEIFKVLQECAEKGFEKERVEGVLHQMELSLKHDSAQFGMRLLFGITRGWFDGVDPVESILLKEQIGKLREKLAQGPFFEGLIRKYFLENESRLVFTMRPDPEFEVKLKEREKTKLAERLNVLSEAEKEEVYKAGLALLQAQGESQDVSVLPTLTVDDIPKQEPSYPLIKETKHPRASEGLSTPVLSGKRQDTDVYWRHAATNGITYFKALIPLNGLPSELRPYLSIFADALSSLGTKTKSASDFENEILLKTDGIAGSTVVTTNPHGTSIYFPANVDLDIFQEYLGISTACLDQNIPDMYNLLRQFIFETNWDNEAKLSSLIKTSASGLVNSVADSGSRYAALYAGSKLTQAKVLTSTCTSNLKGCG